MYAGLAPRWREYSSGRLQMLRLDLLRDKAESRNSIEQATYRKAIRHVEAEIRKRGGEPSADPGTWIDDST